MKILTLLFLQSAFCLAQEAESTVRFANGDQLSGKVLTLTLEDLTWQSPILAEPAKFALKHVVDVTMSPPKSAADRMEAGHEATLEMTNGDVFHGQLSGLSDEEIRLTTWYAGELVFRRVNVEEVKISRAADTYYRGPNSIEEWTQQEGSESWSFRDSALHCSAPGGIAREIDFPDEAEIIFEAEWRGAFRPKIIFFSDDITTTDPEKGYEMVFQGNSVHVKKSGSNNWLGHSTNAGELRENEKAEIRIRASKKTGKIVLLVDGERIDVWEDEELDPQGFGKGFHIVAQDSSPLKISEIKVTSWDGYVEEVNPQARFNGRRFRGGFDFDEDREEVRKEEEVPEGRMVLRNGDTMEGEITGVDDDQVTVKTEFSEVTFPISRLKNLILKKADMETPKRNKGDVRATLSDGSEIVFRLDGVEKDKLLGFSQNFGSATFARDAFKKIEFNIYPKFGETRPTFDSW